MDKKFALGATLAVAAIGVLSAGQPASAYGQNDWRSHPSSQGWRWSMHNHTWYRNSNSNHRYWHHENRPGDRDDMRYSQRNHTWYNKPDGDEVRSHPASQGWRWSQHDHMWYQSRRR